jgi:hypothetical protein
VLRAVRLVGDDDDIATARIGCSRIYRFVELVDQGEEVRVILLEQPLQVVAVASPP